MSGCCSGPLRIVVEFDYLTVDGNTCDRCGDTHEAVRAAASDARVALPASLAVIDYLECELTPGCLGYSNRVLVNGRPAEEWLGGVSVMSDCPSCSELVGESVCCREIEVGGVRTEAVGRDVVFDAIMTAAGLTGEARSAVGGAPGGLDKASAARSLREDSEEGPASAPPLCCTDALSMVTLVTGPGCG
ncbi:MAG TPA: DUF2703 domain-containing protein [Actinobacteria bacterium]|nr:DUF2703 domain-containing protein [Actinomycetota bacterium]